MQTKFPPDPTGRTPEDPASAAARAETGTSLQAYLTRLVWLCVLPLLLLAVWLAYDSVRSLRTAQDQEANNLVRNFSAAVDQHLNARIRALNMLAVSPLVDNPAQWPALYQEAQGFYESFDSHVVLSDVAEPMQMLFNTRLPYGSKLPALPKPQGHAAAPAAVSTGWPAVGDSFIGPVANERLVAIAVPVLRHDKAAFVLLSPMETRHFQELLDQFALPAGWVMSLRDGRGEVIAQVQPPDLDPANDMHEEGRFELHSGASPWSVVLEIPRQVRWAPLLTAGTVLALLLLLTSLGGLLGGVAGGRRLGRAVASLTQHTPSPMALEIQEIRAARSLLDATAANLRHSEARFRRLFQDAPVGLRLAARDGKVLAQNARFDQMFGFTQEEIPTLSAWWKQAYPDLAYREQVLSTWKNILTDAEKVDGNVLIGEYRITRKDGVERIVQVHASVLADGLLSSFNDVTERRETESKLRLWAESFEHAQLGLALADPHSNSFIAVNPAFARDRGYERDEMVGMPLSALCPPDRLPYLRYMAEQLETLSHAVFETEHLRKDGSRFPVLLDITVLRDTQGQAISRMTYALDITERRRAEAEVQNLTATLEKRVADRTAELSLANQELDSFAYTVSHDLRAPLRAMEGYSQILVSEYGDRLTDDAKNCLQQITAASEKMSGLIEGILALSRSARDELRLDTVDLSELASRRLAELARSDPSRQVNCSVQPGLQVTGDARMMDALITNLVSNAWKYTGKTEAANIHFFARSDEGRTWFCMADNGAGFDPAYAEQLFQPFQRLHQEDQFPGIGIGLATVQRIVQRHGGNIVAEAAPGQGATFSFTVASAATGQALTH
ncbi:PAS domain S-box protein [Hydrogenophaga sp.]|uniref:sensor histidine kinase n=1 Tax=Hydrogenophaga sp. TaxID=1904254 RepID=UPI003564950B